MAKRKLHKRRPAFEDDTSILPSDILFFILINLPVKSLLRFKCVSKPWNVIISDNKFKKAQRDQSKALGREKLLVHYINNHFEFRDDLDISSQQIKRENQVFPLKRFRRAEVLCSCDGLVLLKNRKGKRNYVLWNPSTRYQYRTLSCPKYNEKMPNVSGYGLCYDSSVHDYKVILIYDLFYAVYSLNNNFWTKRTSFPCPVQSVRHGYACAGVTVEGCVFWSLNMGFINLLVYITSTIIYFDVKADEVKKLPKPDFVGENDAYFLIRFKGCLSLCGGATRSKQLDIWIMEQDGWKWLMNICNLPTICKKFIKDRILLCCTRKGDVLFQGWFNYRLYIYNPRQQIHTEANIPIVSICLDSLYFSSDPDHVKRKRKRRSFKSIKEGSRLNSQEDVGGIKSPKAATTTMAIP